MAYDFQDIMDRVFFDSDSLFSTLVTGMPSGGLQKSLYVNIVSDGPQLGRMKGGNETSLRQIVIDVSKTDWAIVTKNADKFTMTINGESKTLRVVTILSEDDFSYRLALA